MRLFAAFLFLTLTAGTAAAQTYAGGHYSALALEYPDQTRSGVGGFVVFSRREWLGADVAATWAPAEVIGGSSWQLVAGPRVGRTVEGLGVYGRVRPGFIRFSERFYSPEVVCIAIFPPPDSCLVSSTNFSLDLGGTVELEVAPRVLLRLDLGDTLVRYRRSDGASWKHGLQFTVGLGWRL
jgi:hypothetical protein